MVDDASHYRALAACYARGALGRPDLDDEAALAAAGAVGGGDHGQPVVAQAQAQPQRQRAPPATRRRQHPAR